MFGMTAFVALAALAARYVIVPGAVQPGALFAIPVLFCCAVGTLRNQIGRWLLIGIGIDLLAFIILQKLFGR
jgi:hypothetical protein